MDSGLWPPNLPFSPAGVVLTPWPAAGILSEQLCNGIAGKSLSIHLLLFLKISPLPFKPVGLSAWPQTFNHHWLELFQRKQNQTKRGLSTAAPSLSPAGTRRKQLSRAEEEDEEHLNSRINHHWAAPSPVHSTLRSSCDTQDSALTFPEILWRGSDSCRSQRHQPEEMCGSGDNNFQEMG